MKDLIIVGAGGFGREALYLALSINSNKRQWNIRGFIDDNAHALDSKKCDFDIIGKISEWQPKENEVFAIGISSPQTKEKVVTLLKNRGARFVTLIGNNVSINHTAKIGEGSIITSGSIGDHVQIGKFVNIAGSMIGQDSEIGDFSTTTAFVNTTTSKIGKRVFIGSHAVLLATVEDDAYVCAGSIVFTKVKAGTKVLGNPAKIFKF